MRRGTEGFSLSLAPSLLHAAILKLQPSIVPEVWHREPVSRLATANAIIRGWLRFLSRGYGSAHGIFHKNAPKERGISYSRLREFAVHTAPRAHVFTPFMSTAILPLRCRGPECVMFTRLVCDGELGCQSKKWPAVISRELNRVESEYCLGSEMDTRNCRPPMRSVMHFNVFNAEHDSRLFDADWVN